MIAIMPNTNKSIQVKIKYGPTGPLSKTKKTLWVPGVLTQEVLDAVASKLRYI